MSRASRPTKPREADALGLLGLARRAGGVVTGVDRTRRALDGGELHLVLLARDASGGQLEKVRGLLRHRRVPARWVSGKAVLGAALGEGSLSVVGITMRSIAEQLLPRLPSAPPESSGAREASEGTGGTQSQ